MTEQPPVAVDIIEEGPCLRLMKAEIPAEQVQEEIETSYRQLRGSIQLPGFRKGRVPRSLLERRYAEKIEKEVREELLHRSFHDEIQKRELHLFGEPTFVNVEFELGAPLRFDARFEIVPAFEIEGYKGIRVTGKPADVSEDDVERELQSLRDQSARLEELAIGDQREGDIAVIRLELRDGGEPLLVREDLLLKFGSDRVDSIKVEGLGRQLLEAAEGAELAFQVEIPDEFPREELRGRRVELRVTLTGARRQVIPEADEVFAAQFGVESVDELRGKLHENLRERRRIQEEHRQEEQIVETLLERLNLELPPSAVEQRRAQLAAGLRFRHLREGKPPEEIDKILEQDSSAEEHARRELKERFVLDRVAEQEKILVTEDELARRIATIAVMQNRRPEEVLEDYRQSDSLNELRGGLLREKVRVFLREQAEIIEPGTGTESNPTPVEEK